MDMCGHAPAYHACISLLLPGGGAIRHSVSEQRGEVLSPFEASEVGHGYNLSINTFVN